MDEKLAREMAEYIQLTDGIMADDKATIEKQAAELATVQKTASDTGLDSSAVDQTIDNCIEAGFLKEAEKDQAVAAVNADPSTLLGFLDKLASHTVESRKNPTPLGKPAKARQKEAAYDPQNPPKRESDEIFERAFNVH